MYVPQLSVLSLNWVYQSIRPRQCGAMKLVDITAALGLKRTGSIPTVIKKLKDLLERKRYGVFVHAYVLMTIHIHLLMTPLKKDSIRLAMQSLDRL